MCFCGVVSGRRARGAWERAGCHLSAGRGRCREQKHTGDSRHALRCTDEALSSPGQATRGTATVFIALNYFRGAGGACSLECPPTWDGAVVHAAVGRRSRRTRGFGADAVQKLPCIQQPRQTRPRRTKLPPGDCPPRPGICSISRLPSGLRGPGTVLRILFFFFNFKDTVHWLDTYTVRKTIWMEEGTQSAFM